MLYKNLFPLFISLIVGFLFLYILYVVTFNFFENLSYFIVFGRFVLN